MSRHSLPQLVAVAMFSLAIPVMAIASATPAQKCAGAKMNATSRYSACFENCVSKAVKLGVAIDAACVFDRCGGALAKAWTKIEAKGGCVTPGDHDLLEYLGRVFTWIQPLIGTTGPSRCTSAVHKEAGKDMSCKLKCQAKPFLKGSGSADPACLAKCSAKFDLKCNKAQALGDCSLAFTCSEVESAIDERQKTAYRSLPLTSSVCCEYSNGSCQTNDGSMSVTECVLGDNGIPLGSSDATCDHRGTCVPRSSAEAGPACVVGSYCIAGTGFAGQAGCAANYFGIGQFEPSAMCRNADTPESLGMTTFVTSAQYPGNFAATIGGGLLNAHQAADLACASAATSGGLAGVYKAWLSTSAVAAGSRFLSAGLPYVRPDGVKIADDWADLIDGTLDAPISLDEFGVNVGPADVWTATAANGTHKLNGGAAPCLDWTSANPLLPNPRTGATTVTDSRWSDNVFTLHCGTSKHLFCIRDQ